MRCRRTEGPLLDLDHAERERLPAVELALIHTFAAKSFERIADRSRKHAGLFHLLGEIVFGLWALVLVALMALVAGCKEAIEYVESRQYTEPLFVFVIMVVAASRPVLEAVRGLISAVAGMLPLPSAVARAWLCLALVPLIGSFVTEPAAMTLAALMLAPLVFRPGMPEWLKYGALGVLFVNVSIGGTLTSFAAPPRSRSRPGSARSISCSWRPWCSSPIIQWCSWASSCSSWVTPRPIRNTRTR